MVISADNLIPAVKSRDYSDFGIAGGFSSELDLYSDVACTYVEPPERNYYFYVSKVNVKICQHGKILTNTQAQTTQAMMRTLRI